MNPFASLIAQLEPTPPLRRKQQPIEVEYTITRTYRPRGTTLHMLNTLRDRGPMTSAELAIASGVPARTVPSMLRTAATIGLVQLFERDGINVWAYRQ